MEVTGFQVVGGLVDRDHNTKEARNLQPSLIVNQKSILKGILLSIVLPNHIDWLHVLLPPSKQEALLQLFIFPVEGLLYFKNCFTFVKGEVIDDYLVVKQLLKVNLL